jgi:hypothetical protein
VKTLPRGGSARFTATLASFGSSSFVSRYPMVIGRDVFVVLPTRLDLSGCEIDDEEPQRIALIENRRVADVIDTSSLTLLRESSNMCRREVGRRICFLIEETNGEPSRSAVTSYSMSTPTSNGS